MTDEINIHDHKIITNSILSDPIKEEFSPKKIESEINTIDYLEQTFQENEEDL